MAYNDHDDLKVLIARELAIPPQSINGTVTGDGVDMISTGAYVLAKVSVGTVASGGGGNVKLQESLNDNAADAAAAADPYADITGADVDVVAGDANSIVYIPCHNRSKRWVRAVCVTTGATLLEVTLEAHPLLVGDHAGV